MLIPGCYHQKHDYRPCSKPGFCLLADGLPCWATCAGERDTCAGRNHLIHYSHFWRQFRLDVNIHERHMKVHNTKLDLWSIWLSIVWIDWQRSSRVSERGFSQPCLEMPWNETGIFYLQIMCPPAELWPVPKQHWTMGCGSADDVHNAFLKAWMSANWVARASLLRMQWVELKGPGVEVGKWPSSIFIQLQFQNSSGSIFPSWKETGHFDFWKVFVQKGNIIKRRQHLHYPKQMHFDLYRWHMLSSVCRRWKGVTTSGRLEQGKKC